VATLELSASIIVSSGWGWWDGTAIQQAELLGWWNGSAVQSAELVGWWDGSVVQPVA